MPNLQYPEGVRGQAGTIPDQNDLGNDASSRRRLQARYFPRTFSRHHPPLHGGILADAPRRWEAPATASPGQLDPFDPARAHDQPAHNGGTQPDQIELWPRHETVAKQIAGIDAGRQPSRLFLA